ncbi:MAG: translational GTPase TypA, partial [Fimbriimonadaceae bacterium]|nr:translational GTPase TypA [Alphaproteobacteria bacterium]
NMVDGAVVLVDAAEGPMPQTKFVVAKALKIGLKPIVAINKIDKPDERHAEVVDATFDLFAALGASDEQLDFPILYGSAKDGWMSTEPAGPKDSMTPLFDLILDHVPTPVVEEGKFRMLTTTLEANPFLGRILTGRISSGTVRANTNVVAKAQDGTIVERGRISKVLAFRGLEREPVSEAHAGDIVALSGLTVATVADTIGLSDGFEPIEAQPIDPPTLAMTFRINDGPLAGQEGDKVQSRVIRDRLMREAEGNIALQVSDTGESDAFEVAGRGELQLAVLIETMRREGFELCIGRPRILPRTNEETGETEEPIEEITIDVDEEYAGAVVQKLSERRSELIDITPSGTGRQRLVFHAPTRGLIGYHGELMTDTRGTAIMNRMFLRYAPHLGPVPFRHTGVLISNGQGKAVPFALWNLEDRGPMMIEPGVPVYAGMIIGEHTRGNDLEVNPLKAKQLTNIRAAGKDDAVALSPPTKMTLDKALAFIADDELVEATPKSIRLRKAILDSNDRKRAGREKKTLEAS